MDDFVQSIQDKKQQRQLEQEASERHSQILSGNDQVKTAVLNMAQAIIESNLQHQPDVSVKNFPQALATSEDIQALKEALEQSQQVTQESTENHTEGLTSVLERVLDKLDAISKQDHTSDVLAAMNSLETALSDKDVSITNIDDMGDFFFSLEQKLDELNMQVNVEKPDLSPLESKIDQLIEAVNSKEYPEMPEVSFPSEIFIGMLEEMQSQRLILQKILARPIPVGSGGALGTGGSGGTTPTDPDASVDNIELQNGDDLLLQDGSFLLTQ